MTRTQMICLHEGVEGNVDQVFIQTLIKALNPTWLRPFGAKTLLRVEGCNGRPELISRVAGELRDCVKAGSLTTLMVMADLDDNIQAGDDLQAELWKRCRAEGIGEAGLDRLVCIFAKDRIENWIEFLLHGATNEQAEGPRVDLRTSARAARRLAQICRDRQEADLPPSLAWSCKNWRRLESRMKARG